MSEWAPVVKEEPADEDGEELDLNSETLPVTCGALSGVLHVNKFLCPGIRQACIEIAGEEELITPKDFTVRANKDRQKDWKGSIRMGKNSVRALMETKKLDFFNHTTFCSAKCQSRNYITPKEITENLQMPPRRQSLPARIKPNGDGTEEITLEDILKIPEFSHILKMGDKIGNRTEGSEEKSLRDILKKPAHLEVPSPVEIEGLCEKMNSDPTAFWTELMKINVADEVIDQMISSLNTMRSKLKYGNINNVAPFLSRSVTSLGVMDRMKHAIVAKKTYQKTLLFNRASRPFMPRKPILGDITSVPSSSDQHQPYQQQQQQQYYQQQQQPRSSIDYSSMEEPTTLAVMGNSRKRSVPFRIDPSTMEEEQKIKREVVEEMEKVVESDEPRKEESDFAIDTSSILLMNQGQSSQDLLMQLAASIEDKSVLT